MVHNAVVGLDRDRFRGGGRPMRLRDGGGNLRPLRGDLGVRPAAHSFVPRDGRGNRPPEQLRNRAVVATRAARDPIHRLRAQGVDVASARDARPNQRIVHPRGGADRMASRGRGADAIQNAPLGAENGRGHRMEARPGRMASERPQAAARERGRAFTTPPPRMDGRAMGHAAPTRPEPQRDVARGRGDRLTQPTPAPRMGGRNDETRNARRAEPPARKAPDGWAHRAEPNPRREAPRAERPRFDRQQRAPQERSAWRSPAPQRSAPQREVRRAPAPDMGRQRTTRFEGGRGMQHQAPRVERQAPRTERQADRGAQRPRGGGGRGHQRDG